MSADSKISVITYVVTRLRRSYIFGAGLLFFAASVTVDQSSASVSLQCICVQVSVFTVLVQLAILMTK